MQKRNSENLYHIVCVLICVRICKESVCALRCGLHFYRFISNDLKYYHGKCPIRLYLRSFINLILCKKHVRTVNQDQRHLSEIFSVFRNSQIYYYIILICEFTHPSLWYFTPFLRNERRQISKNKKTVTFAVSYIFF